MGHTCSPSSRFGSGGSLFDAFRVFDPFPASAVFLRLTPGSNDQQSLYQNLL